MISSDLVIRRAAPREKTYRISDGEGMWLEVRPNGAKYWRMKYYYRGVERRTSLGVYPKTGLAEARQKRQSIKDLLTAGKDPKFYHGKSAKGMTFQEAALEWVSLQSDVWSARYAQTVRHRLDGDVFPRIGGKLIGDIDAQDILSVISPISARGAHDKAKRVLRYMVATLSYSIAIGEATSNPAQGLHIVIKSVPVTHNPHLTQEEVPELVARIKEYDGYLPTRLAMQFLLLTMTRTNEVRFAEWGEIKGNEWHIPADRMKMRRPHIVPLSDSALCVLDRAKEIRINKYIFPSAIKRGRPMSKNAILYALYDMGYRGKLTGHGFRATASTILNEQGFNPLAIERQLAHVDKNKVRKAYNHAEYLNERREILNWWAEFLALD